MDVPTIVTLRREPGPLARSLVALILRLALGLSFLIFGINKLEQRKAGDYPKEMKSQFEKTWLAERMPWAIDQFAEVLPLAEVAVGLLLIAGLTTTLSAFLTGLLLIGLLFGQLVLTQSKPEVIARIPTHFIYILVDAAILWLSPVTSNYFSVDGILFGWFWKPRSEGEFRRDETLGMAKHR